MKSPNLQNNTCLHLAKIRTLLGGAVAEWSKALQTKIKRSQVCPPAWATLEKISTLSLLYGNVLARVTLGERQQMNNQQFLIVLNHLNSSH